MDLYEQPRTRTCLAVVSRGDRRDTPRSGKRRYRRASIEPGCISDPSAFLIARRRIRVRHGSGATGSGTVVLSGVDDIFIGVMEVNFVSLDGDLSTFEKKSTNPAV